MKQLAVFLTLASGVIISFSLMAWLTGWPAAAASFVGVAFSFALLVAVARHAGRLAQEGIRRKKSENPRHENNRT